MSKILYKFLAIENEEQIQRVFNMLEFGEIYFSSPANFNDPFDSKPYVLGLETTIDQISHLAKVGRQYGEDVGTLLKRHKEKTAKNGIKYIEKLMTSSAHSAIDQQGVNVDSTNKRCIARFAREKVPGIDVSQAVKAPDTYGLTFSRRLV